MKKYILILLILTSCTTTKKLFEKKTKTDTTTESVETGTVTSTRDGDTLTIRVPSIVYKDTTIYKRGKTTTLIQRYNSDGVLNVDCISDEINELKNYVKNALEQKNEETDESTKDVERGFKDIFVLYGFLGLAFLMLINHFVKKLP